MEREAIMTSVNGDGNGGNGGNGDDQESGDSSENTNSTGDDDADGNGDGNDNDDNDNDDDGNNTEEEDPNAAAQSLLEQATKLKQSMTAAERGCPGIPQRGRNSNLERSIQSPNQCTPGSIGIGPGCGILQKSSHELDMSPLYTFSGGSFILHGIKYVTIGIS